ncbi:ERCC4 domain-containing protein [Aspergillus alliaceus]|uniref:ERCC4 domain-containing protein n=1 Tax=Petromyces alliaceus TaxID=209559 RepID=A0A5N7BY22_PETAA|nr:ERCC4 domain-containing protein [Aspergillus alliaceus]
MPEVINLLSSTPPPPSHQPRQPSPSSSPIFPSNPIPDRNPPITLPILSSDFDFDQFNDDDLSTLNPPKRLRVSEESSPAPRIHDQQTSRISPSKNPLFLLSNDILPSSGGHGHGPANLNLDLDLNLPVRHGGGAAGDGSDPIVFTSSAPEPEPGAGGRDGITVSGSVFPGGVEERRMETITIDDDDDDDDDDGGGGTDTGDARRRDEIEGFSDEIGMSNLNELLGIEDGGLNTRTGLSNRTASLLASLDRPGKARRGRGVEVVEELEVGTLPVGRGKATRRTGSKVSGADKEAKARSREASKAQREREKQAEKERKQKAKEEKARAKQLAADLAEVNKLKVDKKESTPEMIIELAAGFEGTSVGNQTVEYMKRLKVEQRFFESAIANVVRWRRKVSARYNESLGYWEPCSFHIRDEEHVLVLLPAQEFVDMVIAPPSAESNTNNLDAHVQRLKSAYPGCTPIYLIEGLTAWMRKNSNSRNRAYQAEVRRQNESQMQEQSQPTTSRRKKTTNKPETIPVNDDTIEDALLTLQVTHSCLIHHTNSTPDSSEWIKNFTEHISTVPYRRERMEGNDSAFCMDGGQVKPGENKSDTFIKMLQEVTRVTASMAYGIATRYPSAVDLVRGMRTHGPAMLEDVKKSANRNGALTDSRIGPAASKRLYKVFMGLDPSATDI